MALSIADLETAQTPDGPPRDRYGRYRIPDPDTGKPRSWTRATTIAKTIEDPENLTRWKCRMVATGVAQRPSIAAGLVAAQGERHETNRLVEQAMEAAGANEKRELGTNLHRILELVDTGRMPIDQVPDPWAKDVRAYKARLAEMGLTVRPDLCELVLLHRPLEIAGTCDRVYEDHEGRLVIADIKTGGYIGWLSFAMQFAIYATATHTYNPADDTVTLAPEFRQDHTLMVHIPAGSGLCNIEPLSVAVGYDAVLMALEVRRTRAQDKRNNVLATTWQPPILKLVPDQPAEDAGQAARHLRADLTQRIAWLKVNDPELATQVARRWPEGIPTLSKSSEHTHADLLRIASVFDQLSVPF